MCAPENVAKRDVLQRRLAENLAKRVVWRLCAAENIAFRGESAREAGTVSSGIVCFVSPIALLLTVSCVFLVPALLLLTVSSGIVCFVSPIVLFIDSIVCFASSDTVFADSLEGIKIE